eukprot:1209133-Rhodomonas_salina.1
MSYFGWKNNPVDCLHAKDDPLSPATESYFIEWKDGAERSREAVGAGYISKMIVFCQNDPATAARQPAREQAMPGLCTSLGVTASTTTHSYKPGRYYVQAWALQLVLLLTPLSHLSSPSPSSTPRQTVPSLATISSGSASPRPCLCSARPRAGPPQKGPVPAVAPPAVAPSASPLPHRPTTPLRNHRQPL